MISEGSCDIEDWSNDAENTALHHMNKWFFFLIKKETVILNCSNISQYEKKKIQIANYNFSFRLFKYDVISIGFGLTVWTRIKILLSKT